MNILLKTLGNPIWQVLALVITLAAPVLIVAVRTRNVHATAQQKRKYAVEIVSQNGDYRQLIQLHSSSGFFAMLGLHLYTPASLIPLFSPEKNQGLLRYTRPARLETLSGK